MTTRNVNVEQTTIKETHLYFDLRDLCGFSSEYGDVETIVIHVRAADPKSNRLVSRTLKFDPASLDYAGSF